MLHMNNKDFLPTVSSETYRRAMSSKNSTDGLPDYFFECCKSRILIALGNKLIVRALPSFSITKETVMARNSQFGTASAREWPLKD